MSVLNSQNQKTNDEEEIYFNFINSIKSETTKRVYDRDLKFYLNFCGLNKMSGLLEIKDPQRQIINYIMHLRKKGLASNSVSTMLMGIYHFYEMNDVPLNKKKINMFKGEFSRKVIDRAYTDKEIKKTGLERERQKVLDRIEEEKDPEIKAALKAGNTVEILE